MENGDRDYVSDLVVKKWGSSHVLVLNGEARKILDICDGDTVNVTIRKK